MAICLFVLAISVNCQAQSQMRDWQTMRNELVEEITRDAEQYLGGATFSPSVLEAISKVERHKFVPENLWPSAYENHPLPIGDGQTISQPIIVALMTDLLKVGAASRVLELGTGSGYQAAVLAELVKTVYSIEIVENLAERARHTLMLLGYGNVHVRHGDGTQGWPEHAPFDAIIVTAAGIEIPQSLIDQLAAGGRLVMPVGSVHAVQQLKVLKKNQDGTMTISDVLPVRFVPITETVR
jgi:protein-L-isoaspartate(D-aspartate) O-methyltransferase